MVFLGLLLILLGALAIVAVVFDLESVPVDLLGAEISSMTVFFIGVASGVAILWGFGILKFGTKRTLRHRREQKELAELNEKLDRAEAEQKADEKHDHS
jgi:hypothetical protein